MIYEQTIDELPKDQIFGHPNFDLREHLTILYHLVYEHSLILSMA